MTRFLSLSRGRGAWPLAGLLLLVAGLSACRDTPEKQEEIRPVRSLVVAGSGLTPAADYSGEVRARVESRLGFRVPGKIAERLVDAGVVVREGQVLARLDERDLALQAGAAQAAVKAAESEFARTRADYERFQQLRGRQLVSEFDFRRVESQFRVAESQLQQARAQADVTGNQATYAELKADAAGVVTEVLAEAGQVVAAGQTVMTLARSGEREVEIAIPESRVDELKNAASLRISLWALPEKEYVGKLRELAPDADPVTRTYRARISVENADKDLRLGMTANVLVRGKGQTVIRLPLTAIYQAGAQPQVWIIDADQRVQLRAISVSAYQDNDVIITSGLQDGDRVVTAGVNRLHTGQQVRVIE